MKVLIVSDTHKSHGNLRKAIEDSAPIDMLIHLGDVEGGEGDIRALAGCPVHILGGNNDFFSELPREEEFFIDGLHLFITHGHNYFVAVGEEELIREARGRGADIVMYGHTHKPSYTEEEDLIIVNPGSIAYPRQSGRKGSYMLMETDDNGKAEFTLKYV